MSRDVSRTGGSLRQALSWSQAGTGLSVSHRQQTDRRWRNEGVQVATPAISATKSLESAGYSQRRVSTCNKQKHLNQLRDCYDHLLARNNRDHLSKRSKQGTEISVKWLAGPAAASRLVQAAENSNYPFI